MTNIGEYNVLVAYQQIDAGMLLVASDADTAAEEFEKILLPNAYLPNDLSLGDPIEVFIYLDSEDRVIATNLTPKITLNNFAYLPVKEVNTVGAFLDMGLAKDLLVPFRQQATDMQEGKSYLVCMYLDETTKRLIASSKVNRFLSNEQIDLMEGEEVDLIVVNQTDLGYNVIVNKAHKGLVFKSAIFQELHTGDELKGFVKTIREDNKLDVILQQQGVSTIEPNAQIILDFLKDNDGRTDITDKSAPELISTTFGMSKKAFKRALGALYKKRLVKLGKESTELL
ncbi:MAG: putative RNA-binding protein (virulence factor B family) [Saprospiraceae bacterium]|jgi:predicted RNA-binding protein (virulence factor B family)